MGNNLGLKKIIFAVLVATVLLPPFATAANDNPPRVTLILRYDDYSAKSPIAVERKIIEILRKNHAKAVFAVIPFACAIDAQIINPQERLPLTPEKIALLKYGIKAGVVEVALHGNSHQTIRSSRLGCTEFAGEKYDTQLRKIREGKQFLEKALGVPITTFIPPWNQYDQNTCKALSAVGIRMLSANVMGPLSKDLEYVPCTTGLSGLRAGVVNALRTEGRGHLVVSQFHHFDFRERSIEPRATMNVDQLDTATSVIASQGQVRFATFADLTNDDFSVERYEENLARRKWAVLLPTGFSDSNAMSVYLTKPEVHVWNGQAIRLALGFYGAVMLVAVGLGLLLANFIRIRPAHAWGLLLLGGLAVAAYLMVHAEYSALDSRAATYATLGMAAVVGLLWGRLRSCRQCA